jgi:hypothetical protein
MKRLSFPQSYRCWSEDYRFEYELRSSLSLSTISGRGSLLPCTPVFSDVYGYYGDYGIVMRIELLWDILISGCL